MDKLLEEADKNFYRAVKRLGTAGAKKPWSVDVFLGRDVLSVGNEVLDFFSGVAGDVATSALPRQP